jgi:Ni,Fe-hydrogenase III component G
VAPFGHFCPALVIKALSGAQSCQGIFVAKSGILKKSIQNFLGLAFRQQHAQIVCAKSLTENECESFQEVADHIPRGSKHEREVTA